MFEEKTIAFEENATKFNVGLQCGDCLHYKGSANPRFDAPCVKRGVGTKSEAPACYTPDVSAFRSLSKDVFPMLASLVSLLTPKLSRVLMGVLKYSGSLEKIGLNFLEVCYFCNCSVSEAYLEDYYCGYALAMTKGGQIVLVGSDYLRQSPSSLVAYLDKGSVLREPVFQKRREKLIAEGKIYKLKTQVARERPTSDSDYVVPTIDDAPQPSKVKAKKGAIKPSVKGYVYKDGDYSM